VTATVTLDDLCRPWQPGDAPWLDQLDVVHDNLTPLQRQWRDQGFVVLEGAIHEALIVDYEQAWLDANNGRLTGWPCDTPYRHTAAVSRLCGAGIVAWALEHLLGEPAAVHLNLTGWRSTTRAFHQDAVLNPDTNRDHYAAVWFALDDIHPDAGPFEYVPGSHREFGQLRQDLVLDALGTTTANTSWPRDSERLLTPLYEQAIAERNLPVRQFLPRRGTALIWHSRLLHRGSIPTDPNMERRACIAHYSTVSSRPDMPPAAVDEWGTMAFPIHQDHSRCGA
jgi:hypothetical protein